MTTLNVAARLSELESSSLSQQDKATEYVHLLQEIVANPDISSIPQDLAAFVDSVIGDSLGIVSARPLLNTFVESLRNIENVEIKIEAGQQALRALESRVVSFEEQDATIRELLADSFQGRGDYIEAAKVLQGIQLESSQRKILDDTKVRTWIRICRLYLEEDDPTSAESYLNRAKNLLYRVNDREIRLTFQLSHARISDSRRKFLDASQAYHAVSLFPALAEDERNKVLSQAIICAVLAPAGPQRSRALGNLFKDERSAQQGEFAILENMFLDRFISPTEVDKFANGLAPHQVAKTSDGSTVLAKAVIEHNLLGVSRLYNNIGLAELGTILGLDTDRVEEYASRMLEQGRLNGTIDQIRGVIFFHAREDSSTIKTVNRVLGLGMVQNWDMNVQGLADNIEKVYSHFQAQLPGRVAQEI